MIDRKEEKILEHDHWNLLSFLDILDIPDGGSRARPISLGFLRFLHHDLDLHGALPGGLLVVVVDVTDLLHVWTAVETQWLAVFITKFHLLVMVMISKVGSGFHRSSPVQTLHGDNQSARQSTNISYAAGRAFPGTRGTPGGGQEDSERTELGINIWLFAAC